MQRSQKRQGHDLVADRSGGPVLETGTCGASFGTSSVTIDRASLPSLPLLIRTRADEASLGHHQGEAQEHKVSTTMCYRGVAGVRVAVRHTITAAGVVRRSAVLVLGACKLVMGVRAVWMELPLIVDAT